MTLHIPIGMIACNLFQNMDKVWNTDETSKVPDSVTVQLLRNGSVVKTATLNTQNQWQVTFPDMPESDDYSVREINIPQGFTVTYAQNGYSYTVTNTAALLQTGQLTWPIPAFVELWNQLIYLIVLNGKKCLVRNIQNRSFGRLCYW